MRTLLILALPAAFVAGAANAEQAQPTRQCRIDWSAGQPSVCRVAQVAQSREAYETPAHHVMTKAEIRAELDAIRLGAPPTEQVAQLRPEPSRLAATTGPGAER